MVASFFYIFIFLFFFSKKKHVQQQQCWTCGQRLQVLTGCFTSGMGTALSLQRERVAEAEQHITGQRLPSPPLPPHPGDLATNGVCIAKDHSQPAPTLSSSSVAERPAAANGRAPFITRLLVSRNSTCSYHKRAALFTVHRVLFTAGYHMMTQGGFDISDPPAPDSYLPS